MKQGQASRNVMESTPMIRPVTTAINPGAVGQIGIAVDPKAVERMHQGRGFMAPEPVEETCHHCGSQGKYK